MGWFFVAFIKLWHTKIGGDFIKQIIRSYLFIFLGTFILAVGISLFLTPIKLSCGGVSAIGTVLFYTLNIPLSLTNLVLNSFIYLFSFGVLGKGHVLKTVAGTLALSLFLEISSHIPTLPLDFFTSLFLGGVLVGLGVGIVIRFGGSTGGSDLLALALRTKLPYIPLPTVILALDLFVILLAGIVFKDFTVCVYSGVAMLISSRASDLVINYGARAKMIFIVTKKSEEIKRVILNKFERGVTEIYTRGGFSEEKRLLLFSVLSPKEASLLTKDIKKIDPHAFLVICNAKEVLGEGFLEM